MPPVCLQHFSFRLRQFSALDFHCIECTVYCIEPTLLLHELGRKSHYKAAEIVSSAFTLDDPCDIFLLAQKFACRGKHSEDILVISSLLILSLSVFPNTDYRNLTWDASILSWSYDFKPMFH
jgi:hypothetical protein